MVLGVDIHEARQIAVAVGYFEDYELARTPEGYHDTSFTQASNARWPMVNLYPVQTTNGLRISYYVIRQDGWSVNQQSAFIDVAVLQSNGVGGTGFSAVDWGVSSYD